MQLRPMAAQILSGSLLQEKKHRLGNVQRDRQREAELRVSLHSEATQQGGVDAVLTTGGTEPVRAPVFIVGAQARKRKGRERESEKHDALLHLRLRCSNLLGEGAPSARRRTQMASSLARCKLYTNDTGA